MPIKTSYLTMFSIRFKMYHFPLTAAPQCLACGKHSVFGKYMKKMFPNLFYLIPKQSIFKQMLRK